MCSMGVTSFVLFVIIANSNVLCNNAYKIYFDNFIVKVYNRNKDKGVIDMDEIIRMQENLLLIRRTVGWTAEEFGDRIGVTRQTINNIEFGRNKLTKTQYIAMRSVLDAEMAQSPDDTAMLRLILDALVDHPDRYDETERSEILSKANLMAPAILAGTATRETVSKEWVRSVGTAVGIGAALSAIPIVGAMAGGVVSAWMLKAIEPKRKKK